jgi:hypothetical protein
MLLTGIFTALYVLSNLIAMKQTDVGSLTLPLGLLAIPITFLITDVVNEIYGPDAARGVVTSGFVAMAFVLCITQIAVRLSPSIHFQYQEAFALVFGAVPRITLGSVCAYVVSQYHDVWAFEFWRRATKGKHLWIRNNLSTIASQAMDTAIFVLVAFGGTMPIEVLKSMILGQLVVKWILALLDTPFCYLLVAWAKDGDINLR